MGLRVEGRGSSLRCVTEDHNGPPLHLDPVAFFVSLYVLLLSADANTGFQIIRKARTLQKPNRALALCFCHCLGGKSK